MVKIGSLQAQSAVNQQLPRRGLQQVSSAHHLGYFHCAVVYDHRQLISRNIISAPDDKIPEVAASNISLKPEMLIIKPDFLVIRHSKTPIHPRGVFKTRPVVSISTISGI